MNKRKMLIIKGVISTIEDLRIVVSNISDEEGHKFDNLAPGIQESDIGKDMLYIIDKLDKAAGIMLEVTDCLSMIREQLYVL